MGRYVKYYGEMRVARCVAASRLEFACSFVLDRDTIVGTIYLAADTSPTGLTASTTRPRTKILPSLGDHTSTIPVLVLHRYYSILVH